MGRQAEAPLIHRLRGTYRADRHSAAFQIPGKRPRRPRWLTGEARAEWDRLSGILFRNGLLDTLNFLLFAVYCQTYAEWRNLSSLIEKLQANPNTRPADLARLIRLQAHVTKDLLRLGREFRLVGSRKRPVNQAGKTTESLYFEGLKTANKALKPPQRGA